MTGPAAGISPPPSGSSGDVDLFGTTTTGRRRRPVFRVVLTGLGPKGEPATSVRVSVLDGETGQRIGARTMPFSWIRDVGFGGGEVMNVIEEGVWE